MSQILVEQSKKGAQSLLLAQIFYAQIYHQTGPFPLIFPMAAFSNVQISDLLYGRSGHIGSPVARDYLVIKAH